jgi:hypothetical protein
MNSQGPERGEKHCSNDREIFQSQHETESVRHALRRDKRMFDQELDSDLVLETRDPI